MAREGKRGATKLAWRFSEAHRGLVRLVSGERGPERGDEAGTWCIRFLRCSCRWLEKDEPEARRGGGGVTLLLRSCHLLDERVKDTAHPGTAEEEERCQQ